MHEGCVIANIFFKKVAAESSNGGRCLQALRRKSQATEPQVTKAKLPKPAGTEPEGRTTKTYKAKGGNKKGLETNYC